MKKIKNLIITCVFAASTLLFSSKTFAAAINYTVKSGDSLYKIAQNYNTTVSSISSLNNITNTNYINVGQTLLVNDNRVQTINYKVVQGDNLWSIARKYGTTENTIIQSNMLVNDTLMIGQILTIPVNSQTIVAPVGITMMTARKSSYYGDIYTWENARRLFTVGTKATLKDVATGITFNVKNYGGSNHADIVPLTTSDTANMKKVYPVWSWSAKRPMVITFTKGGINYQIACSLIGMPHSTTDIYDNGMNGQCCLYFYNSVGHSDPTIQPDQQLNVLKANGQ